MEETNHAKNPNYSLALYEKAMPSGLGFGRMLECAAQTGFDRLEISIDESDARLARLDWTCEQKQELVGQIRQSGVPIRTMCLSGHRKYPFGAHNAAVRARSLEIMKKPSILRQRSAFRSSSWPATMSIMSQATRRPAHGSRRACKRPSVWRLRQVWCLPLKQWKRRSWTPLQNRWSMSG